MGLALAGAFHNRGASVFLICGPGITPSKKFKFVSVVSAREMYKEVQKRFPKCDLFVAAAAVSDFRPAKIFRGKMKRNRSAVTVELVPNPDILESAALSKKYQLIIGFALESVSSRAKALQNAKEKMVKKSCGLLVLNSPSSMESDSIDASLLFKDGRVKALGKISKKACAAKICEAIARN